MPTESESKILRWERFVSIETFGALIVTVFMIGVSWANLAARADSADKKVAAIEKKSEQDRRDMTEMRASIKVIENNQERFAADIKEIQSDIKKILSEVRKTNAD